MDIALLTLIASAVGTITGFGTSTIVPCTRCTAAAGAGGGCVNTRRHFHCSPVKRFGLAEMQKKSTVGGFLERSHLTLATELGRGYLYFVV